MPHQSSLRDHPITLLAVPYAEREQAKAVGARWNATRKFFYVNTNDVGTRIPKEAIEHWLPRKVNRHTDSQQQSNALLDFANAIRDAGLVLDGLPIMDGKFHNIPTKDNKRGRKSGSYIGFLDGVPAGYIKNFQSDVEMTWSPNSISLTPEERLHLKMEFEAAKLERERETALTHEKVAQQSEALFHSLTTERPTSCYLDRKKVGAHHVRFERSTLVVPMQDIDGRIWSLLRILNRPEDNKRNAKGGRKDGLFHLIGEVKPNQPILFSEGYSTSASLHEATGHTVVTTFSHNNMDEVLRLFKAKYPNNPLFLAGDDDKALEDNPGRTNATLVAKKHGAGLFFPEFSKETSSGTDFNDLHTEEGLEIVAKQADKAISNYLSELRTTKVTEQETTPQPAPVQDHNITLAAAVNLESTDTPPQNETIDTAQVQEAQPTAPTEPEANQTVETEAPPAEVSTETPKVMSVEVEELQLPPEELTMDAADPTPPKNAQDEYFEPRVKSTQTPPLEFEKNGFVPVEADSEKPKTVEPYDLKSLLEGVTYSGNLGKTQNDGSVLYMVDQAPAFVDHGQQILMVKGSSKEDKHILAAMLLAQEKFGNAFQLTGSDEFKRKALQLMIENKVEVKLKDPAQVALKKEIEKELQQQKEKVDAPASDKAPVFIGKPAQEENTPINKNIIAVSALEMWNAQKDLMANLNEEDKNIAIERLGPPPPENHVYWFDQHGSLSKPPENPERYLAKPIQVDGFKPINVPIKVIEGKEFYEGKEQTSVQLFQGEGRHFYGQVMDGDQPRFVIATMTKRPADPETGEIKPDFIKLMTIEDGKPKEIGYGNAVNTRNDGKQNTFDEVLLKVGSRVLRSKVCEGTDPETHRRLGFLEQVRRPQESQKIVDLSSSQTVKPTQTETVTQTNKPDATESQNMSFLKRLKRSMR